MSRENVEIVRRFHDAFNTRDIDGLTALFHDDAEYIPILAKLEGRSYRGPDEMVAWIRELDHDWAEFQTAPTEFQDLGDIVLSLGTWHARARTSDVTLDSQPGAWVTHVRDGKILRHETFTDREQALEAVGLSE
jgi:ketosteroid isomerase-like protein